MSAFSPSHELGDGTASAIPRAVLDAAIDWMVLLRSGTADDADYRRFEAWRVADPGHAKAWARVTGTLERSFVSLREAGRPLSAHGRIAEQILLGAEARHAATRRKLLTGMVAIGAAGAAGLLATRQGEMRALVADLRTGTGERQTFSLPDGSIVTLNACSSADVQFDGMVRVIRLRKGELVASVTPDATRPFEVRTDFGTVRALGTRFLVRQQDERSFALVLEHTVKVDTDSGMSRVLGEGESVWFDRAAIDQVQVGLTGKAAWLQGMLTVDDEPLDAVIDAIRPYRHGFIRISPEAARLRVLGAFPLDDTDRLLESLVQTLPIRIDFYSRWLVVIDVA